MSRKTHKPYAMTFACKGVALEARRIEAETASNTKWNTETFAVNFPGEPGSSIDSIQIFYDSTDDTWRHWPTKFSDDHKTLGSALAEARNNLPELFKYKVRVNVHKYSDLSDRPVIRCLPSEGKNPSDAVYRLRDQVDKERDENDGVAAIRSTGKPRYIGAIFLTGVSEAY